MRDHETGLSGWKCSFFPTSNIYITLYFNVSSTLLRKNRNTDFLHIYIDMYKMTLTWINEPREWIFHPLSTWPVLCKGGGLFRWQVGHVSVTYFFFSGRQYLLLFLFYRIAVSWLSYSVSVWSLGQHVCRFSPVIPHLSCRASEVSETYKNHPVSLKIHVPLDCKQQSSTKD